MDNDSRPLYWPLRKEKEMDDAALFEMFRNRDEAELIDHIQRMSQSELKRYAIPAVNRLLQRRLNRPGRARLARIVAAVRVAIQAGLPDP